MKVIKGLGEGGEFNPDEPPRASSEEIEEEPLRPPDGSGKPKLNVGGGLGMTVVVSVIVAFVVFFVMGFMGGGSFLTKQQFEDNLAGMVASLDQAKAEVVGARNTVDSAIAGLPTTVTNQVNSIISSVNTKISTLESEVDALQTKVSTLEASTTIDGEILVEIQTSLDALILDVEELQEQVDGTTITSDGIVTSGALTAELKLQFFDYILLPKDTLDTDEVTIPFRLKLTNNSTKDIEDIRVGIIFEPTGYTSPDWAVDYPKLEGGVAWNLYGTSTWGMVFVNGWGLKVDAGDTKTIPLTLRMKVATTTTMDYTWEPEVDIDDYEVVD